MSSQEQPHDLNLERNLTRQLQYQVKPLVSNYLTKHDGKFERKLLDQEIVKDTNELRKRVLSMIEGSCKAILDNYGKSPEEIDSEILQRVNENDLLRDNLKKLSSSISIEDLTDDEKEEIDYEAFLAIKSMDTYSRFIQKHGWYEHVGAGIRHKITRDELAYELCEIIRKVYYIHLEDQIPEKYKTEIIEQYNMKETDVVTK